LIENELELAHILREKLTPNFKEIYVNVNLASNKFYPHWEKWHGKPVPSAQPQIDLLLVDRSLWLLAAELKYFRKILKKGQINLPFYAGIDEALALLRFGFKIVSLWHFFDEKIGLENTKRLCRSCELLVYNLKLPINYQAFRVTESDTEIEFWRLYDVGAAQLKELPTAYGTPNPFESNIDAQRMQDFFRNVFRIPHPR
jgi:hypothetical protein